LILYCAAIFYASHQPTLLVSLPYQQQDKFVHLLVYAVLATLTWRYLLHWHKPLNIQVIGVITFVALYAASDEYHQSFIVGRTASILDWLADILGAILAVLYWSWKTRQRKQRC
jgi:VanZ family protein